MKFLFVMDPIESLNFKTDTTLEIMRGCKKAGIKTYCCTDQGIFHDQETKAHTKEVRVSQGFEVLSGSTMPLAGFDRVLMRMEPPYDINYHHTTLLLENAKTRIINSPRGLLHANEKLVILNFPNVIPNTLVTKSEKKILAFLDKHQEIVIKPIHLFGGKNVQKIVVNDTKSKEKIQSIINQGRDFAICQEYIKGVVQGDKRVLILGGSILGAFLRVPLKGEFRANMALGGKIESCKLSSKDKEVIDSIIPYLKKEGLDFVGADLIEGKLIEINVTCPTGLVALNELTGVDNTKRVVDYLKNAKYNECN